jgi:hypothetical protein
MPHFVPHPFMVINSKQQINKYPQDCNTTNNEPEIIRL